MQLWSMTEGALKNHFFALFLFALLASYISTHLYFLKASKPEKFRMLFIIISSLNVLNRKKA